jgi:NADPH:quinone reductase-like Zn-dependent oxidoreductase
MKPMKIPSRMAAVQLVGHGGYEKLVYSESVPVRVAGPGEVLIRIAAAGVNNTDINTRIGWYSSAATTGTAEAGAGMASPPADGDWTGGGLVFPRIQGADACGEIVAVGDGVAEGRIGERVIVQSCLRSLTVGDFTPWLGSERDGAFAQFVAAPAGDTYRIDSALTDTELAAIPCAFGTAENLVSRAGVKAGDRVLVTGASGNVGIAAVQLARRRGAEVVAVAAKAKWDALLGAGANRCVDRDAPLADMLGSGSVDVAIDVVGGPQWADLLEVLKVRGRCCVSGAIAGPIVQMDLRKLYLKDLTIHGCTAQDPWIFPALVSYLERGEIRPLVSLVYSLKDIALAQQEFMSKSHVGKIVLVPPSPSPVSEG